MTAVFVAAVDTPHWFRTFPFPMQVGPNVASSERVCVQVLPRDSQIGRTKFNSVCMSVQLG